MEKYEIQKAYDEDIGRFKALNQVVNPANLKAEIATLDAKTLEASFWQDQNSAKKVIAKLNQNKQKMEKLNAIEQLLTNIQMALELGDEELFSDAEGDLKKVAKLISKLEEELLLNGEYDHTNAILEIHPGAGGTESQDWALMLFRMYKRFCEERGFKFSVLDYQEAMDAGIKSVTCLVEAENAYGLLQGEKGVHRLVRISPFDANARRHTSFAGVNITPEVSDDIEVVINPEDLRIDTYRSSGAGGQYINKTDSAVRITHLPTGIVVSCQNERSQIQNRDRALKVLKAKLYEAYKQKENEKLEQYTGGVSDNAFGSQIRSYILHPYNLVKDHRTNCESPNPAKVLDGDLDQFIDEYLKYKAMEQQK